MKLQSPDLGMWMLKRWIYVLGLGFCFMLMLVESDINTRLLAGLGLLVFIQLREISFVEDIDTARVAMSRPRSTPARPRAAKPTPAPVATPIAEESARRDFAAWRLSEHPEPPATHF